MYVVDSDQKLLGVITLAGAWDTLKAGVNQTAADLATQPEHILTEDTDLNQGFEIIEEFVGVSIPVVENTKTQRLTGYPRSKHHPSLQRSRQNRPRRGTRPR